MNSPRFLDELWSRRIMHSSDPYKAIWKELFRHSGGEASDRVLRAAGTDLRNTEPFRNWIALSDEYWLAYEDASELIDSVPLYYGALSLGNAIAYATLGSAQMATRTRGHGLTLDFNLASNRVILDTVLNFNHSTEAFGLINEALGGDSLIGSNASVLELIRLLPELSDRLEHFGVASKAYEFTFTAARREIGGSATSDVDIIATIRTGRVQRVSDGYIRDNFAIADYLSRSSLSIENDRAIKWSPRRAVVEEIGNISISALGTSWFLPKLRGFVVPEYSIYVAILHVFSVFARYVPEYWLKIRENLTDEWILIRDFIDIAEEKVPRLALDHFTRQTNEFSRM